MLGSALLALALAACGDTPEPTPDIEATVQARLNEERAAVATVEAQAQILAKAMVEATAQASGSPVRALSRLASTAHGLPRTAGPGRTGTVGGQA